LCHWEPKRGLWLAWGCCCRPTMLPAGPARRVRQVAAAVTAAGDWLGEMEAQFRDTG